MTEKTIVTEKKTRGPRRSHEEIAADYDKRAKAAAQKAKLANTKGLKELIAARDALTTALEASTNTAHEQRVFSLDIACKQLIDELSK